MGEGTAVNDVQFRPVGPEDLELLLAWRSNPMVFEHFRGQDGPLDWETHLKWFASNSPDRHDFVVEYNGRRVGSVFLDEDGYVGVYVGEVGLWGHGIGQTAVEWICRRFGDSRELFAEVHTENERSRRLFEQCGFTERGQDGDWTTYEFTESD